MLRRSGFRSALYACALTCAAQAPRKFIGSDACRSCHPEQSSRQAESAHARSLYRAAAHPLSGSFVTAEPLLRPPHFRFEFISDAGGLRVRADDGQRVSELPVEWAFGEGRHAVTFVSRATDKYHLEHSFSYYSDTKSFDLTPRHEKLRSADLFEAMGQAIKTTGPGPAISACFGCHSTGPVTVDADGKVSIREAGVRCERCHGPGGGHRPAVPRKADMNAFCGVCHRSPASDLDWDSPWSVRYQPPFLARSRCFQQSSGNLSCVTCHDPHARMRHDNAAYYRARCMGCHQAGSHPPARICLRERDSDCVSCHMPQVTANAHIGFRNHWIGIYAEGGALKPHTLRGSPAARYEKRALASDGSSGARP
jgi:hypothetical protein